MQVKAMLGPELCEKATNGAKQFAVTVAGDALEELFGQSFSKSLRYGVTLELVKVRSLRTTVWSIGCCQFCMLSLCTRLCIHISEKLSKAVKASATTHLAETEMS